MKAGGESVPAFRLALALKAFGQGAQLSSTARISTGMAGLCPCGGWGCSAASAPVGT